MKRGQNREMRKLEGARAAYEGSGFHKAWRGLASSDLPKK